MEVYCVKESKQPIKGVAVCVEVSHLFPVPVRTQLLRPHCCHWMDSTPPVSIISHSFSLRRVLTYAMHADARCSDLLTVGDYVTAQQQQQQQAPIKLLLNGSTTSE